MDPLLVHTPHVEHEQGHHDNKQTLNLEVDTIPKLTEGSRPSPFNYGATWASPNPKP